MKRIFLVQLLALLPGLAVEPATESFSISEKLPDPASIRFMPPPPPKEVPPLEIRGSTTADFGTHRVTILRAEPSTLPDIPEPPVALPRETPRATLAEPGFHLSIGGSTYDGKLSNLEVWNPITRTRHNAWCGWDVSLLAPIHHITVGGKPRSLMLSVSPIDTTKAQRPGKSFQIPSHPQVEPGYIVVPDGDNFTADLLAELREFHQKNLPRLLAIRAAQEQARKDAAAWHTANPPRPQNHTIWLKPHRGSRYLDDATQDGKEDAR